jgi:hypothetical protein
MTPIIPDPIDPVAGMQKSIALLEYWALLTLKMLEVRKDPNLLSLLAPIAEAGKDLREKVNQLRTEVNK